LHYIEFFTADIKKIVEIKTNF